MKAAPMNPALLEELLRVQPSTDDMEYRPCKVTLKDGRVVDRVYVVDEKEFLRNWGTPSGKRFIQVEDVARIEESPVRLPPHLANRLYHAGETGMGYVAYTLVLKDGRVIPQVTGNAVDFPSLPDGVTTDLIANVNGYAGRDPTPQRGPDYYWCLYSAR